MAKKQLKDTSGRSCSEVLFHLLHPVTHFVSFKQLLSLLLYENHGGTNFRLLIDWSARPNSRATQKRKDFGKEYQWRIWMMSFEKCWLVCSRLRKVFRAAGRTLLFLCQTSEVKMKRKWCEQNRESEKWASEIMERNRGLHCVQFRKDYEEK